MNYSIVILIFAFAVSFSAHSADPKILDVDPANDEWIKPDGEYDKVDITVKVIGDSSGLNLELRHQSKNYTFKKSDKRSFVLSFEKNLIPDVDKFEAELILKDGNKEVARSKLSYFCCAMLGYGKLFSLPKGKAAELVVIDEGSPINGLKVTIRAEAIDTDQRAVLSVDRELSAPRQSYLPVSTGFSFRTSKAIKLKGVVLSIPYNSALPRIPDGTQDSPHSYFSKFNIAWEDEKKGELLVLAQRNGFLSEIKAQSVSKSQVVIVLPDEERYDGFLVVARKVK